MHVDVDAAAAARVGEAPRPGGDERMSHYDVVVVGGGAPGEHGAWRACRRRPERRASSSASWSAASAPTGPASHPRRCCARARPCTQRATRRPARRWTSPAALAWRDFMVSDYSDAGQERWLADRGDRPVARHAAGSPGGASSRSTAPATRPSTSSWRPAPTPFIAARPRPARGSTASGPTARRPP